MVLKGLEYTGMIDQTKIEYNKPDLDKINDNQPIELEDKEEKVFKWSFFYNIFNKTFKFKFLWRF